jgi:hypothetical protein
MAVEWGRARIGFTVTEREMLTGSIQVFMERDSEWEPHRSIYLQTSYMPGIIHEAQLAGMLKRGETPEVVEIDIPVAELGTYVDHVLKQMGWRRVSRLDSWLATEPAFPGESPNRAAECEVIRGRNERQYLKRMDAARKEHRLREGLR